MNEIKDCIIIGSGPAGITSAVYLKRANKDAIVISKGIGVLEKVELIENYYGFEPVSGKELYEKGIKQLESLGGEVLNEEVVQITKNTEGIFEIKTQQNTYNTKAVILATGTNRKKTNILNLKELEGKGVSYCAVCDGFFYKNKKIAVLGNGKFALHEINYLKNVTSDITLLTNGQEIELEDVDMNNRDSSDVEINSKPIKQLNGENRLESVSFLDDTKENFDGMFIAMGTANSNDFAKTIGAKIVDNNIYVDENQQTSVGGLFACGDCVGGIYQISKAVYEGTKAGLKTIEYLKSIR